MRLREQPGGGRKGFSLWYILEGLAGRAEASAFSSRRPGGPSSQTQLAEAAAFSSESITVTACPRLAQAEREAARAAPQGHTPRLCGRGPSRDLPSLAASCPRNPGNLSSFNLRKAAGFRDNLRGQPRGLPPSALAPLSSQRRAGVLGQEGENPEPHDL